ncbi:MAG: hypothetical protein EB156_03375 [Euryarchaeota archaeon]|nr:hypothetical protein [Euryarchaeota archaeon]NDF36815.1 hypothetical protein [Euryarchaeota archaeon]NDG21677.1 hypothetical protein [Euryarchaeota archaeon]
MVHFQAADSRVFFTQKGFKSLSLYLLVDSFLLQDVDDGIFLLELFLNPSVGDVQLLESLSFFCESLF